MSTVTSPVFSGVVIVFRDKAALEVNFFQNILFGVLRDMYEVKSFRLVFCLEVWHSDREETARALKRRIDVEGARGGLRFLPCSPVIVSNTRPMLSPSPLLFSVHNFCAYLVPVHHAL